tara:strand:- start:377 stop:643 length:267 start_codon:yes stop_codon:yes gene_type:complete
MTLKILGSVDRYNPNLKRSYLMVFLQDEKETRWNLYLDPKNRNWNKWEKVLVKGSWIKGLNPLPGEKNLIDADSPVESTQDPRQPELF